MMSGILEPRLAKSMSQSKELELLRAVLKRLGESGGFGRVLKDVRVVGGSEGRCLAEFKVSEDVENPFGTLHGGMTATLVDVVSTAALMTTGTGHPGVSVDLNVNFVRAGKHGETVRVESEVLKWGRSLAFTKTRLYRAEDEALIAIGSHTKAFPPTRE